jgi:hypothetical protein
VGYPVALKGFREIQHKTDAVVRLSGDDDGRKGYGLPKTGADADGGW